MMKLSVEILTTTGCSKCLKAGQTIQRVVSEFPDQVDYREVNVTHEPEMLTRFGVLSTPSVIIDGRLAFEGPPGEADLRRKIVEELRGNEPETQDAPGKMSWKVLIVLVVALAAIFAIAFYAFQLWIPVVLGSLKNIQNFSTPLLYSYAFFAGLLTFAAPCAIGILPAYLTFYLNLKEQNGAAATHRLKEGLRFGTIAGTGAALTYIPVLAILYVIPSLVLGAEAGFSTRSTYLVLSTWSKPFIIAVLVIFGIILLTNYSFSTNRLYLFVRERLGVRGDPKKSVFGFGLLYGVGSYGCGMLVVVPLVVFDLLQGVLVKSLISFAVYLVGFFSIILAVTTTVSVSKGEGLERLAVYAPRIKRAAGGVILVASAWLIYFYIKTGGM